MKHEHIALLKGGNSPERTGSLETGKVYARALRDAGHRVEEIDVGDDLVKQLLAVRPDIVFVGGYGGALENGQVQGVLECLGIPYTHSGVFASSLAMNKARCRDVFKSNGLPVAEGRLIHVTELDDGHPMDPPYVIKPNAEGSSVGVVVVRDSDKIPSKIMRKDAEWLLAERYIPGLDLTVCVFEDKALGVCQIKTTCGIWDYEAKHTMGKSERVVPAPIPSEVRERCLELAQQCHELLGCSYISRTDLRWDENKGIDGLVVLEINTQPGMENPETTFRKTLSAHGVEFPRMVSSLLESAALKGCR